MPPLVNITITVPDGTTNHGDLRLLCLAPAWSDYILFFVGNYVAHAASVVTDPGQSTSEKVWTMVLALMFPVIGTLQAMAAIFSGARLEKDPLRRAAKSSALCMVIRSKHWMPAHGDRIRGVALCNSTDENTPEFSLLNPQRLLAGYRPTRLRSWRNSDSLFRRPPFSNLLVCEPFSFGKSMRRLVFREGWEVSSSQKIQGHHTSLKGYGYSFVIAPRNVIVKRRTSAVFTTNGGITEVYSIHKPVIALVQLFFSAVTLYQSSRTEIDYYGYAAYGLTVLPFTIMSLLNLIGNLLRPEYPSLHLVHTTIMKEAMSRPGITINGVIASLETDDSAPSIGGYPVSGEFVRGTASPSSGPRLQSQQDHRPGLEGVEFEYNGSGSNRPGSIPRTKLVPEDYTLSAWLKVPSQDDYVCAPTNQYTDVELFLGYYLLLGIFVSPIAVYGALSKFRKGQSTYVERVLTMLWLVVGICKWMFSPRISDIKPRWAQLFGCVLWFVPPILGWWQVFKMMTEYGICKRLY